MVMVKILSGESAESKCLSINKATSSLEAQDRQQSKGEG